MNKYRNKKTIIDNIQFDSAKESKRYLFLKDKLDKGIISDLELQKKYLLQEAFKLDNVSFRKIEYTADFVYRYQGEEIVEDVKASFKFQDDVYKLKKKLFAYKYGKRIKEIIDPNEEI